MIQESELVDTVVVTPGKGLGMLEGNLLVVLILLALLGL